MKTRLALFLLALVFLFSPCCIADIAIIKTEGISIFDEARNGFASICFENKQEFNLLEDLSNQAQVSEAIKAGNFRLVLAIGPRAGNFARTNFSDRPIIFCLVVNPEKMGLKGENIVGIPLNVPLREQFTLLRDISKKAKRIGVTYTQKENDALIADARNMASQLNLSLVTAPISSSQDIQKALPDLITKCDFIWIPPDSSLYDDKIIRYIGETSLARQRPCIGPYERYVRYGAILSYAVDPVEAGRSAGDLANQVLGGATLSKVTIPELPKPRIIINLKAASLLGFTIPKNILNAASKVYQ